MTGAFVRVKRDGAWGNIEIDQMTNEELDEYLVRLEPEKLRAWVKMLACFIRDEVSHA